MFNDIKVGDIVLCEKIINPYKSDRFWIPCAVTKTTGKRFETANNVIFQKENGQVWGDNGGFGIYAKPYSEELDQYLELEKFKACQHNEGRISTICYYSKFDKLNLNESTELLELLLKFGKKYNWDMRGADNE